MAHPDGSLKQDRGKVPAKAISYSEHQLAPYTRFPLTYYEMLKIVSKICPEK